MNMTDINRIGTIYENMMKREGDDGDCTTGPIADLSEDKFVAAAVAYLAEKGWPDAEPQVKSALAEFLQDEGINYGDTGFGWTADDAALFANEFLMGD